VAQWVHFFNAWPPGVAEPAASSRPILTAVNSGWFDPKHNGLKSITFSGARADVPGDGFRSFKRTRTSDEAARTVNLGATGTRVANQGHGSRKES
jgi:hypothetical protein